MKPRIFVKVTRFWPKRLHRHLNSKIFLISNETHTTKRLKDFEAENVRLGRACRALGCHSRRSASLRRGVLGYIRSDKGPEFIVAAVQRDRRAGCQDGLHHAWQSPEELLYRHMKTVAYPRFSITCQDMQGQRLAIRE